MHSDVYVLVRVGITREHFIAFLKAISVIRDKLFSKAVEHGASELQHGDGPRPQVHPHRDRLTGLICPVRKNL